MKSIKDIIDRSTKITIEYVFNEEEIILKTEIAEISENEIYIYIPIRQGKYFFLNNLKKLNMTYVDSKKNVYSITGKIDGIFKVDNIPCYRIVDMNEKKKIQRRHYFRFPLLLDGNMNFEGTIENLLVKDISEGGLSGIVKYPLEKSNMINMELPFNEEVLTLNGEVLQSDLMEDSMFKYHIRVKFLDIKEYERKVILRKIFQEQRKMKNKLMESRFI